MFFGQNKYKQNRGISYVWKSLLLKNNNNMHLSFNPSFVPKILNGQKIHTFREDKPNRWGKGSLIHFCTGLRSNEYNCFKKDYCISTQTIKIIPQGWIVPLITARLPKVYVDGKIIDGFMLLQLIGNDGFDSVEDFCEWFHEPFIGKIIHWTEFKY